MSKITMEDYQPVFTITPEILNLTYEIAAILERINIIRERALTPQLRRENRIKTIHSSLWIEANTLTIEQVTDIMDGKKVIGPKKDIDEVKNAIIAYDELLACNPYSGKDLLKQHGLLMAALVETAGKYRTGGVGVFSGKTAVHIAPPHHRVPVLMEQLLQWVKKTPLPQVLKSCIFHYEFEFIHPFADGNGRMGRMWQTLLLYQENQIFAWLPVETIVAQKQEEYYRSIRRSTRRNDSGIFTQFMLTALKDAAIEFRDKYLKGEIKTENDTVIGTVNDTVNSLLLQLISHNPEITIDEMAAKVNKSRRTVIRRINKMKEQGIIERLGSDKSGVWKTIEI